jgi:hypothetical protein
VRQRHNALLQRDRASLFLNLEQSGFGDVFYVRRPCDQQLSKRERRQPQRAVAIPQLLQPVFDLSLSCFERLEPEHPACQTRKDLSPLGEARKPIKTPQ